MPFTIRAQRTPSCRSIEMEAIRIDRCLRTRAVCQRSDRKLKAVPTGNRAKRRASRTRDRKSNGKRPRSSTCSTTMMRMIADHLESKIDLERRQSIRRRFASATRATSLIKLVHQAQSTMTTATADIRAMTLGDAFFIPVF